MSQIHHDAHRHRQICATAYRSGMTEKDHSQLWPAEELVLKASSVDM